MKQKFFLLGILLLAANFGYIGCQSTQSREANADMKLSQRKPQADALRTSEILSQPQPGFQQEPRRA